MKLIDILYEDTLELNQRAAWIFPDGTIHNLGAEGHSTCCFDEFYTDKEREFCNNVGAEATSTKQGDMWLDIALFGPMYEKGCVRVILGEGYVKSIGVCGSEQGIANAWMIELRKHIKNVDRWYIDVYQKYKYKYSKQFEMPQDRIALIRFMTEEL